MKELQDKTISQNGIFKKDTKTGNIIIVLLVLSPIILRIILRMGPRKIQNLEYKVPLKEGLSIVGSDISYYDMGITGEHEDDYYEFDDCNLRIEYFEDDVTNNSKLYLVKENSKTINNHKWYYTNSKYFTNYNGNTYVVTITNRDSCNKVNNKVIDSLRFK